MKNATCLTDDQRWQSILAATRMPTANSFSPCAPRVSFAVRLAAPDMPCGKMSAFYANASEALAAGFRPCKRCQPDKANPRQHRLDKITHVCRLLEQETPVTLEASPTMWR